MASKGNDDNEQRDALENLTEKEINLLFNSDKEEEKKDNIEIDKEIDQLFNSYKEDDNTIDEKVKKEVKIKKTEERKKRPRTNVQENESILKYFEHSSKRYKKDND